MNRFQFALRSGKQTSEDLPIANMLIYDGPAGVQSEVEKLHVHPKTLAIKSVDLSGRGIRLIPTEQNINTKPLKTLGRTTFSSLRIGNRSTELLSIEEPLKLTLKVSKLRRKPDAVVWVFDLYRTVPEHALNAHYLRQYVRQICVKRGYEVLFFEDLVGTQPLNSTPKTIAFPLFKQAIMSLADKVRSNFLDKLIVLSFDENNFLAPAIFGSKSRPPPLVLVNPAWNSMAGWIKSLNLRHAEPQILTDIPSATLAAQVHAYKAPILAVGRNRPPRGFSKSDFTYVNTPWKGRFLNRTGVRTDLNKLEFSPSPFNHDVLRQMFAWIEKRVA